MNRVSAFKTILFSALLFPASVSAQYNYAEALQKTMFFYEAQRSGKMPADNRIVWRGDSHLQDGRDFGIDLSGGWYDAGDTPKWNPTMAFAASTLAWSAVAYPKGYQQSGQMPYLLGNLRWVGDYFIKCLRFKTIDDLASYRIFVEVGNAEEEHTSWAANEVMHLLHPRRPALYADKDAPATSIVAAMAASQAVSSVVFRQHGDAKYADLLLANARKLYEFATTYQGNGNAKNAKGGIVKHTEFYDDNRFQDQLCLTAIWLGRALQKTDSGASKKYFGQAETFARQFVSHVPEANYIYSHYDLACFILLAGQFPENKIYRQHVEASLDRIERLPKSPGGLAKLAYEWGALRHVNNAAWVFFAYADQLPAGAQKEKYLRWAKSQLDYTLGSNPQNRSYLLGFQSAGKTVANTPHHRSAYGAWAGWEHLNPTKPEFRQVARHTLYGGLVGGPDWTDTYKAEASDAARTETALDYNAGITASLARMTEKTGGKPLPNFPPKATLEDGYFVEAAIADTDPQGVEIRARLNNRSAYPAKARFGLSFRYYFQADPDTETKAELLDGEGATISQPIRYQGNVFFVIVSFKGTPIFPGGLDPDHDWRPFYRKEATFRLKSSGAWNNAGDWSFKGVAGEDKEPAKVRQISVWDGKQKLSGLEPPKKL